MGIPEYEAKRYEGKLKAGNILISVHTENSEEIDRAKGIFKNSGADDISYTEEKDVPEKGAKDLKQKAKDSAQRLNSPRTR